MARFDRAIATAQRLIKKNGQTVTWRAIADTPNLITPWNPGPRTVTDTSVFMCFLPVDRMTMETFTFMNGTEVAKGSVMGLMGNVSFEPNLKDVVIRDSKELRIANITLLSPNGQKVLYTVVFKT